MSVSELYFEGLAAPARADALLAAQCLPLFEAALHCHDVKRVMHNGRPVLLGDPMEIALVESAERAGKLPRHERIGEVPFDADRRRMSTVHATGRTRMLYCKGAPEAVLPLCAQAQGLDGVGRLTPAARERFVSAQEAMAERGLRVLAFAYRALPGDAKAAQWEEELVLTGLVGLEDPPRPEAPAAIAQCRAAGIKVIMVTGDHPHTAHAIAREIGLADDLEIVSGELLAQMSDTQLQLALDTHILFARVTADQKQRVVQALQRKQHVVAVTGDGVNDAPALKHADIGIAMGMIGTDVAREAADVVLLDDNFASIVNAIEEGRAVFQNIRRFLTYILASNIPEIVPYLAFVLFRIPLPLTIIQILVWCPTNSWCYYSGSVMLMHVQNQPSCEPCAC